MKFREAYLEDIPQLQFIRNSVKENQLSNPGLVTDKDYEDYIINRGKGWVCEMEDLIVGFAIVSVIDNNVWALFIHPDYEGRGIGKSLHTMMMDWYFNRTNASIWLGTAPGTRAEVFYRKAGWKYTGPRPNGEIGFEMSDEEWKKIKNNISINVK